MAYEGGGVDVYQDANQFFFHHTYMTEDDDAAERYSARFDTLEDLLASLPKKLRYVAIGQEFDEEITSEVLDEIEEGRKRLSAVRDANIREYGTADFSKILEIIKDRETASKKRD